MHKNAHTTNILTHPTVQVDCTLQRADSWFYHEGMGYRFIAELAGMYHDSVGHGGNLLLNLAPPPNTSILEAALKLYNQLGNWTRACYGEGGTAAQTALATTTRAHINCSTVRLVLPQGPALIDRFIIKEELAGGQKILNFSIVADNNTVYNGSAVGSVHIALLGNKTKASVVELRIHATRAGAPASINLFAVPDPTACALPPPSDGCTIVPNMLYSGPAFKSLETHDVQSCCDACRATPTCAVFTAVIGTVWPYPVACRLLDAITGSKVMAGAFSGAPA